MEQSRPIVSGAALLGVGLALVAFTFAVTGQASASGPALLAWVAVCGGGLRLLAGIWQRRSIPTTPASMVELPGDQDFDITEQVQLPVAATVVQNTVEESLNTPLEYDFWLLGVEPGSAFREVKQAYWASRNACAGLSSEKAAARMSQTFAAYKRLRRIYQDSGAR